MNPWKRRAVILQRKDLKITNARMLRKLIGRLQSTIFRIMEDKRIKYEQERLRDNYFNFNF